MTNAELFEFIFDIYATELWAMPEKDFLKWLNAKAPMIYLQKNADASKLESEE